MALTKAQKLKILKIIDEEEKGIHTLDRLIGGTTAPVSTGVGTVLQSGQDKVNADEKEIMHYLRWLENKGYICPVNRLNPNIFELTPKGSGYYEQLKNSATEPLDVELDSIVFHEGLRQEIDTLFADGEYAKCVSEAAKFLESELRNKTGAPANVRGSDLATYAFNPQRGILNAPYCQEQGHKEGIHILYRGAFNYIRNLAIHHSDILNDPIDNLQMLSYLDLLVRLLEKSSPRNP